MNDTPSLRFILASNIRRLRTQKNLTQYDLANIINVNYQTIHKIESQKSWPKPETAEDIAKALNVSPSELYLDRQYEQFLDEKEEKLKTIIEDFKNQVNSVEFTGKSETSKKTHQDIEFDNYTFHSRRNHR